jgi:alpha-galactosidase
MSQRQRSLVADAVRVYKAIRADVALAVPFWPLGLPGWTDSWLALGLRAPDASYVTAWRRGPVGGSPDDGGPALMTLSVPHLRGVPATPEVLYPGQAPAEVRWHAAEGELAVVLPRSPSACVLALRRSH